MKLLFKKENIKLARGAAVICAVLLIGIIGVINHRMQNEKALGVSAGYSEYEAQEMHAHEGDVLVDSLQLTEIPDTEKSAAEAETEEKTKLVSSDEVSGEENTDEYFREARATLSDDRNEMLTMLNDTIESSTEGSEKSSAQSQKEKMLNYMETEKTLESMIRTKGYTDAFVLITDQSVTATVQAESLTNQDAAKILDLIMRETGRNAEDIVIQAKAV